MKIKKSYIITLILALIALATLIAINVKNNSVKYQTRKIKRCTITQVVEASGTVNPVNTVSVGSTVSGLIKEIYVDFNSEVKKGQILAQIDPANFQASVDQAAAQINNARANLANTEAVMEMSRKTYNRYKNLYAKNFIAKSELDQAESDYYANLAKVNSAKAQIAQYQATYNTAMTNLGYTKIIAPVDGTIISREIDLGQPVAASFQAPELFTIAQDLTKMQIEVNVSEADIGKVKEGQDVTYTLDGYPDSSFSGKVTQVRISPTTVSNVVTYVVIVNVDNQDLKLIPGMTANVEVITAQKENVLLVPNKALRFTYDDGTSLTKKRYKDKGLWILENGKPVRVSITTGVYDDDFTEVTNANLDEGEEIILEEKNSTAARARAMRMRMPR